MNNKRKQKLIKLYEDNYKEWFYYYDIQDYTNSNNDIYNKFINGSTNVEKVDKWLKLLDYQHSIVYLGLIESLRYDDYKYLNNALYTYVRVGLIKSFTLGSSYDHCISAWNLAPIVLCSNQFNDFRSDLERIFSLLFEHGLTSNIKMRNSNMTIKEFYAKHPLNEFLIK